MSDLTPEQNIEGHAFNALTKALREDQWMPLSERLRIADAVADAVVPIVQVYERLRFLEAAGTFPEPFRTIIAEAARRGGDVPAGDLTEQRRAWRASLRSGAASETIEP
jgi:hypothetical protein